MGAVPGVGHAHTGNGKAAARSSGVGATAGGAVTRRDSCAPLLMQALTNYKYKVKMVPGTQKKGKAYRQARGWLACARVGPQQRQVSWPSAHRPDHRF